MSKRLLKKQRKLSSKETFFNDLAIETGYMDIESVRQVYYAMVKMLTRELRLNNNTRLPDFGDFVLMKHCERKTFNVNTGKYHLLPMRNVLKFEVHHNLKKYFNSFLS